MGENRVPEELMPWLIELYHARREANPKTSEYHCTILATNDFIKEYPGRMIGKANVTLDLLSALSSCGEGVQSDSEGKWIERSGGIGTGVR